MIDRRKALILGIGATGALHWAAKDAPPPPPGFVRVDGGRLLLDDRPYRFVGTNMWYGAYLGSTEDGRRRLARELDRLAARGIRNIRVLGASEVSPLKHSLRPAIRTERPPYDEALLRGLDVLLAEMAMRDLKAVIFLNNFWEWSGGMVTYLYWTNGGRYIDLNDPKHPWPAFADFSAQFYASGKANALYRDYVVTLVGRRNSVTGLAYRDDPTIMAWQLANEPRPGGSKAKTDFAVFYAWIRDTARFIKRHDPHHLVSTGNEGTKGCLESAACVANVNTVAEIDYLTFHIWPLNWSWIDPHNLAGSFDFCAAKTRRYVEAHLAIAARLGKPAVAEEFGFPRDAGYASGSATGFRDRFYRQIFAMVERSARQGGVFAGTNFWAWGGEGRAQHADFQMRPGDHAYVGDPPQEPQGANSVFDDDETTLDQIGRHARALQALAAGH